MKSARWFFLSLTFFISTPLCYAGITVLTTNMPPYVSGNGKQGIAMDLIREMFKRAGQDITVKSMPLPRAIDQTTKSDNHCVVPIQRSQERETSFKWVSPILVTQSALFSKANSDIDLAVLKDAKPYKIGSMRGTAVDEYLQGAGFGFEVNVVAREKQNIQKLKAGRIELWATDAIAGPYLAKQSNVGIKQQIIFRTTLRAVACHIGTPDKTIEQLTEILKTMYSDGTVRSIYNKYSKDLDVGDLGQFLN